MMQTSKADIDFAYDHYQKGNHFNEERFYGFAGTEIMRRLIGLAQLPLTLTLAEKEQLLVLAASWIK